MKTKLPARVLLSFFCTALAIGRGNSITPQPGIKLPPQLARVMSDYEKAWRNHDPDGLSQLFAEDGFVLQNGRQPVRGRSAIKEAYRNSGGPLVLTAFAFEMRDGIGYIIGGYARAVGEPDVGKFTLTLKKGAAGKWLIMSDMDNANMSGR